MFWQSEFQSWNDRYRTEALSAIQNKLRPFLLSRKLRWKRAQTLFGELAIGGTAEIHMRVHEPMPAVTAFAGGVIFEEFDRLAALGAFDFKNGPWFPVTGILSWAFHRILS